MNLGQTLKYQRMKRGMTQEEFADFLGIARGSIAHYERGDRLPSPKYVKILSDKLKTDIAKELITNEVLNNN